MGTYVTFCFLYFALIDGTDTDLVALLILALFGTYNYFIALDDAPNSLNGLLLIFYGCANY